MLKESWWWRASTREETTLSARQFEQKSCFFKIQYDFLPKTMGSKFSVKLSKFSLFSAFVYHCQFKLSNLNIALESYFEDFEKCKPLWQIPTSMQGNFDDKIRSSNSIKQVLNIYKYKEEKLVFYATKMKRDNANNQFKRI